MKKAVDDYIQEGIYGAKETKPDERRRFLGSLRERTVLALTKAQVMKGLGQEEMKEEMRQHPKAKLLLNGQVHSRFFTPYKQIAKQMKVPYTNVSNRDAKSDLGAILTYDEAIDKEHIFLETTPNYEIKEEEKQKENIFQIIVKRLFSKK
ncbi:YueI family protein [Salirhabdus salicampi]|uniref:YueI family protein n=1 Tax=Salirhabdus salicampi TaxID=476102 RepID=UPI0020C25763|nr:YueI family protein [Salirhabdus salicampi]MCP8616197.1 YueI family protein [Salirhabdus salicampi]